MITEVYYGVCGNPSGVIDTFKRLISKECKERGISYKDPSGVLKDAFVENAVFAFRITYYQTTLDWGFSGRQEFYKMEYERDSDEEFIEKQYKEILGTKPKCIRVPQRTQGITEVSTVF